MNPTTRRFLITFFVTLAAGVLVSVVFFSPKPPPPKPVETTAQPQDQPDQSENFGGIDPKELTKKEAQMMLENYLQNVEPDGLLNLNQQRKDYEPVLKDW